MLAKLVHSRFLSSVILGVALLVFAGIGGFADSPTVTYNGCQNLATGTIRLLPSSLPAPFNTTCNTTTTNKLLLEKPITWNQVGPQGPQGIQGLTGATGPQGPKGDTGSTGAVGVQGPVGATGAPGPAGADGAPGAAGPAGQNGTSVTSLGLSISDPNCPFGGSQFTTGTSITYACNGAAGAPGAQGIQGPKGDTGATGPEGPAGSPLTSIDALSGIPCGNGTGTVRLVYGSSDSISLVCDHSAPSITSFTAAPANVAQGGPSSLTAQFTGANSGHITAPDGTSLTVLSGQPVAVTPQATMTYTLAVANGIGSTTATTTVTIPPLPQILGFTASPTNVICAGREATALIPSFVNGVGSINGQAVLNGTPLFVSPPATTIYVLTVTNSAGVSVTAAQVVNVETCP